MRSSRVQFLLGFFKLSFYVYMVLNNTGQISSSIAIVIWLKNVQNEPDRECLIHGLAQGCGRRLKLVSRAAEDPGPRRRAAFHRRAQGPPRC